MNEELRWMLVSINHLLQAKDYYGAFVFCLIAIEPLVRQKYPKLGNADRFQRFLHEERQPFWPGKFFLPDANKSRQGSTIGLPDDLFSGDDFPSTKDLDVHLAKLQESMISIEKVLWKYCRNPIVHEGSLLAVDGDTAVTLDWTVKPTAFTLKVDQEARNVIVISAPYLLRALYQVVAKHLGEQLGT